MIDPRLEQKRATLLEQYKEHAWRLVVDQPGSVEDWVVLIADDRDPNANVILRELGILPAAPEDLDVTVVTISRAAAVRILAPRDAQLAAAIGKPTPMKATAFVMAHGGWSTAGIGRGVGFELHLMPPSPRGRPRIRVEPDATEPAAAPFTPPPAPATPAPS
jgi:hypothetical protein